MALAITGTKTCNECKKRKHVTDFGILKRMPDGRNPKCIPCMKAWSEAYQIKKRKGLTSRRLPKVPGHLVSTGSMPGKTLQGKSRIAVRRGAPGT